MDNQNINGTNGMGNLPNAQGVYGGGMAGGLPNAQGANGMGSTPSAQPQMSPVQLQTPPVQPPKKLTKKLIIIGIAAVAIIAVVIIVMTLVFNGEISKAAEYLPKKASEYDAICIRSSEYAKGMTMEEVVGLEEMDEYGYISYSFVRVISKDDGSAIKENDDSWNVAEETVDSLASMGLSATSDLKDGKVIVRFGLPNYDYSKVSEAVKDFKEVGYSCN